jgi:hypothetical protein
MEKPEFKQKMIDAKPKIKEGIINSLQEGEAILIKLRQKIEDLKDRIEDTKAKIEMIEELLGEINELWEGSVDMIFHDGNKQDPDLNKMMKHMTKNERKRDRDLDGLHKTLENLEGLKDFYENLLNDLLSSAKND